MLLNATIMLKRRAKYNAKTKDVHLMHVYIDNFSLALSLALNVYNVLVVSASLEDQMEQRS